MDTLEEMFGIDPESPEAQRADFLVDSDMRMLDKLVQIRRERGLTQAQVGAIMGVSQPTVAEFEATGSNPRLSTIRRYAQAVEALVRHEVEPDRGQAASWSEIVIDTPATIRARRTVPSQARLIGADHFRRASQMNANQFALAA